MREEKLRTYENEVLKEIHT